MTEYTRRVNNFFLLYNWEGGLEVNHFYGRELKTENQYTLVFQFLEYIISELGNE